MSRDEATTPALVLSAYDVRALAVALAPAFRAAGLAVVPIEPTQAMLVAAGKVDDRAFATGSPHGASDEEIYITMVEAAHV